ncbi:hypothetical protein AB4Y32_05365 [Paraburkholderia phymatum]|uniref:Uncharacterized protein n=1 Tax=Paraburkholderia phymatum TaxID=148447 RepID=A0ACC6TUY2_9BURK
MTQWFSRKSFVAWGSLPALFTVFVIWYPFGLSLGAMLEEWDILYLIQKHPDFWNSFPGHLLSDKFAARPMQTLPHYIAHLISANSFEGFHLILMVAVLMRIMSAAAIGHYLFRNRAYAAAFGVMAFVFPADTQQFEFRTFHITVAVGMMVCSAACTIRAFEAPSAGNRWLSLVVGSVLACMAVMIYEPALTLYAIAPAVMLAREGFRPFFAQIRLNKPLSIAWIVAPLINAAYLFYAIVIYQSSYQVNASGQGMGHSVIHNLHYLIGSAAYRVFFDTWVSMFWILGQIAHPGYIALISAACIIGMLLLTDTQTRAVSFALVARYWVTGLLLIVAAYLPYMVAETHMRITQRTFMAGAPGASLVLIAMIAWLFQRRPFVGTVAAAVFVMLGIVAQLYQFDKYTRDYVSVVRPYTSELADRIDLSKKVHLVFDRTGFGGHLNGIYSTKVQTSPTVRLRQNAGISVMCLDSQQLSSADPFAACTLSDGKWTVRDAGQPPTSYPAAETQVITMGPGFDNTYRSVGSAWRDQGSFKISRSMFKTDDPHAYHCEADSMWGYSGYCRGEGWTDGIFDHSRFVHQNWFSAYRTDPTLIFQLTPVARPYELRLDLFGLMDDSMTVTMHVTVNDSAVSMRKIGPLTYVGTVPTSSLETGQNVIAFDGALPPGRSLGLSLVGASLTPN